MPEERANALVKFGADNVFQLASVRIGLRFGDQKRIGQEPFGEATTTDDVSRAMLAAFRERDFAVALDEQSEIL